MRRDIDPTHTSMHPYGIFEYFSRRISVYYKEIYIHTHVCIHTHYLPWRS